MSTKDLFSNDKLMNRFFRPVQNVVWDLMSGKIGVRTKDNEIATLEIDADGNASVNINLFEQFGVAIPAFAQNTPKSAVVQGDLIYVDGKIKGWVLENTDKAFKLVHPDGGIHSWTPPKVQMFGLDGGVMVARSLINMLPGGSAGLGGMQANLLPLLAMSGGDLDLEKMMPLMLMTQMGTPGADPAAAAANPMANMMPMLMMMSMMKGGNKSGTGSKDSPLNNFFDMGR